MAGFRKFSPKKSIKARTTGRAKRSLKKAVNPLYGKKGMGYLKNPSKAVKNSIYHKTTIGVPDLVKSSKSRSKTGNTTSASTRKVEANQSKNESKNNGCFWLVVLTLGLLVVGLLIRFWYVFLIIAVISGILIYRNRKKKRTVADQGSNISTETVDEQPIVNDDVTESTSSGTESPTSIKNTAYTTPSIHKLRRKLYDFVVFDIETTGLSKTSDEVIQLSALKFRDDKLVDQYNTYVNPHMELEKKVIFMTGIKDENVRDAPEINTVIDEFTAFIEDLPLIGHNIIKFDLPFLSAHGFDPSELDVIDTVELSSKKLPELENHKLPNLKHYYGITNQSHNSLNDCQTNAIVYQKLRDDQLEPITIDPNKIPKSLAGKRFCITGQFIGVSREELVDEITSHGGKYTRNVSGLTDYLLDGTQVADNLIDGIHSSNELHAAELQNQNGKIKIITYDQFEDLVKEKVLSEAQ